MHGRQLILLILAGFMTAAQAKDANPDSPWFVIPVNTVIRLNQPLTIPAEQAGVYMQFGEVKSDKDVDEYYANCRLEVNDVRAAAQEIEADSFTVYRVQLFEDYSSRPLQFAAGPGFIFLGDGPTPQNYATIMYLRSARQPLVRQLVCKHLEDPALFPEHLTVKQMQAAMGKIITIEIRP